MGFLWPVHKASGLKKAEAELSEDEKLRMAEDIERDQTANAQRGQKIDAKAIELGKRLLKGVKGRESFFDDFAPSAKGI
jgi:hypothetical protein